MQVTVKDIKVKEGTTKAGPNTGKPWKLIILIGEDGTEFTTFDASAQEVGVGGIIELEPVIKAGKINFTDFKIIQKGSFQAPPPPRPEGTAPAMTPDMWDKKQQVERHSIETQTIFKGIMELAKACIEKETNIGSMVKFNPVYDAALDWAMAHFTGEKPAKPAATKPTPQPPQRATGASKEDLSSLVFPDAGKLLTYLTNDLGMNGYERTAATAGYDLTTEQGRKDCWISILETRKHND